MSKTEPAGILGKAIKVEAGDGRVIMTLPVKEIMVGNNTRDEAHLLLVASFFKHLLYESFSLHSLELEHVYIQIEVPEKQVRKELKLWLQEHDGAGYAVNDNPLAEEDAITRFMPRVVDVSGENNGQDGEQEQCVRADEVQGAGNSTKGNDAFLPA